MANILNESYFNLNNWTKNMTSFPVFQNEFTDGVNTLDYQGGGGYERLYISVTVETNKNYQFKFNMHSPSGFTMGDYGHNYAFAFVRTSAPNDTGGALSYTNMTYSENWDANASDVPKQYTINFNSGNYTTLYIALDFGYILDGVTTQFVFSDFILQECASDVVGIKCMPVMRDVNSCFDARIGVTDNEWQNQAGDINFQLFNPIISKDGMEIVGSDTSYGKFSKTWISGSSRTWYFVFKNTSGVYSDWKTIIGNESGTYTCSTIAMDGNGYIKFTRPDIVPSTSLGFRCSDWHVVAWVSNGSNRTTRLFIDGTYIGYTNNMQGWANDTYLGRGSGWWYGDNNTVFRAIAIADSAHSDADVVTNSNWLRQSYVSNYISDLYERKYLVRNETGIYTITDNALTLLTETELNAELFQTYGVDSVYDHSILLELVNPELLCWSPKDCELPIIKATLNATPHQQNIISEKIDLTHVSIKGIESATVTCEGNVLFAVSFDDKQTWHNWNGTEWVQIFDEFSGMTKELFESATSDDWELLSTGADSFYIRTSLLDVTSKLTKIYVDFIN